ncbi:MAG: HAD-IIB family hydrolase [Ruminococcaceae bacterium]|nr:HAD-IIB family hydrolase [Oscillospiraceae bacterium]
MFILKIIASDYDGTLNHGGIDEKKKNAISRWRKEGNIFSVVSGRGAPDLIRIYNKNSFECDYLIADNGAVIMKPNGVIVCEDKIDVSVAKPFLEFLFSQGCKWGYVQTSFPCRVFKDNDFEEYDEDECFIFEELPEFPYIYQINTALESFEEAARVTEAIKEKFGDVLNPLQNGTCIDIVSVNMDKAKGIYKFIELLGAEYEDVITVGDNINDKDMIKEFRSYAMENAVPLIKELADFETPGITELIERELSLQAIK